MKKIIGLAVAALVTVGIIAGCNSDNKSDSKSVDIKKAMNAEVNNRAIGISSSAGLLVKNQKGQYVLVMPRDKINKVVLLSLDPRGVVKQLDHKHFVEGLHRLSNPQPINLQISNSGKLEMKLIARKNDASKVVLLLEPVGDSPKVNRIAGPVKLVALPPVK